MDDAFKQALALTEQAVADQVAATSDTPRTDALAQHLQGSDIHYWWQSYESLARGLERELAAAQMDAERWNTHIRLMRRIHSEREIQETVEIVDAAIDAMKEGK